MQLGFDEVYVIVETKIRYVYNEVLYDSRTADEKIEHLNKSGDIEVKKMSLEQYIEMVDPNPR